MNKKYRIEMEVSIDVPDDANDCDVEEYIAFELGAESSMNNDNAVLNSDDAELLINEFEIYEL